MEPKRGMIATNGKGVLGMITEDIPVDIRKGGKVTKSVWVGVQISGSGLDIGDDWQSHKPKVLCHISDLTKHVREV